LLVKGERDEGEQKKLKSDYDQVRMRLDY